MWTLRKRYAGNGGVLPPNDPRLMAMTEEQMLVELSHFDLDVEEAKKAKGGQSYEDESYEEDEEEEERRDAKIYVPALEEDFEDEEPIPLPKSEDNDDEWVDDETSDDEDWDEDQP